MHCSQKSRRELKTPYRMGEFVYNWNVEGMSFFLLWLTNNNKKDIKAIYDMKLRGLIGNWNVKGMCLDKGEFAAVWSLVAMAWVHFPPINDWARPSPMTEGFSHIKYFHIGKDLTRPLTETGPELSFYMFNNQISQTVYVNMKLTTPLKAVVLTHLCVHGDACIRPWTQPSLI